MLGVRWTEAAFGSSVVVDLTRRRSVTQDVTCRQDELLMAPTSSNPRSDRARLRRHELLLFATLAVTAAWMGWATLQGDAGGLLAPAISVLFVVAAFGFSRSVARRRRFCPTCGRLVAHGLWRRPGEFAYCLACQELADPSAVLCGRPGFLDLSRPRLLAKIPAMTRCFCSYVVLAIRDRATEVAFLLEKDRLYVSYVVDGVRRDLGAPPLYLAAALIATIKAAAGLDARNVRDRQRGPIDIALADAHVQMDVEVQPGQFGDGVLLRLPGTETDVRAATAAQRLVRVV
jgi:hypothetical protein